MQTQINFLWPTWARVVARFKVSEIQARGLECWHSVKRAAALLVERQEREHKARFYREVVPLTGPCECSSDCPYPKGHGNMALPYPWRGIKACLLVVLCSLVLAPIARAEEHKEINSNRTFCKVGGALKKHEPSFGSDSPDVASDEVGSATHRVATEKGAPGCGSDLSILLAEACSQAIPEQESKLFRALGFAVYATSAGDGLSTELALRNPGTYEANPINEALGARIATHIGAPITVNVTTAKLYRDGKKKRAIWMRIAFVGAYGYLTAHNLRLATR